MIQIEFTSEEIDTLAYECYYYPDPKIQKNWRLCISRAWALNIKKSA